MGSTDYHHLRWGLQRFQGTMGKVSFLWRHLLCKQSYLYSFEYNYWAEYNTHVNSTKITIQLTIYNQQIAICLKQSRTNKEEQQEAVDIPKTSGLTPTKQMCWVFFPLTSVLSKIINMLDSMRHRARCRLKRRKLDAIMKSIYSSSGQKLEGFCHF